MSSVQNTALKVTTTTTLSASSSSFKLTLYLLKSFFLMLSFASFLFVSTHSKIPKCLYLSSLCDTKVMPSSSDVIGISFQSNSYLCISIEDIEVDDLDTLKQHFKTSHVMIIELLPFFITENSVTPNLGLFFLHQNPKLLSQINYKIMYMRVAKQYFPYISSHLV